MVYIRIVGRCPAMLKSETGQSRHFDSAPRTSALLRSADIADRVRQVRKVPEPDVTQSFVAGSWTRSISCRCRSHWSGRATLLAAEIGRVQLFSSCHALLGSEHPY